MGYSSTFDNGQGVVYLIGGEECWNEIKQKIEDADEFVRENLKMLDDQGKDMGLEVPSAL